MMPEGTGFMLSIIFVLGRVGRVYYHPSIDEMDGRGCLGGKRITLGDIVYCVVQHVKFCRRSSGSKTRDI